jgi:hypothetical protein
MADLQKETVSRASLFDVEADLLFPRRFDVVGRVHGNPIRCLVFDEHVRRTKITPYSKGKVSGFIATDRYDRKTFLSPKNTTATLPADQGLHIPGLSIDGAQTALAAHSGRWFQPKPADPNA